MTIQQYKEITRMRVLTPVISCYTLAYIFDDAQVIEALLIRGRWYVTKGDFRMSKESGLFYESVRTFKDAEFEFSSAELAIEAFQKFYK